MRSTFKSLEQNGFIYRKRDEQDARVMRIYLTEKGKELEVPVEIKWKAQQEKLLHSMTVEDRLILRHFMQKLESLS
ncbi:MarR family winged helix-turn-helix transcriptional regulator [Paenibacillus sp. 8b26]|uniref:MarR family winged helix-turn-helix transcriptional regulator n=1 Tax=Paenibacillus sp. 8b26 TaxID=3424133 RepID=UPI003D64840F